jgi:hypothetical protein
VKKMDNLFSPFNTTPHPSTSPIVFHIGLAVLFDQSKACSFPERKQYSRPNGVA